VEEVGGKRTREARRAPSSIAASFQAVWDEEGDTTRARRQLAFLAGNPLWPCPSNCCEGLLKQIADKKGGFFAPCDQKDSQDLKTCQVSCSILGESVDLTLRPAKCV